MHYFEKAPRSLLSRSLKLVPQNRRQRLSVAYLLREAHNFLTTISDDRLDFEKAKAAVMAVTDI